MSDDTNPPAGDTTPETESGSGSTAKKKTTRKPAAKKTAKKTTKKAAAKKTAKKTTKKAVTKKTTKKAAAKKTAKKTSKKTTKKTAGTSEPIEAEGVLEPVAEPDAETEAADTPSDPAEPGTERQPADDTESGRDPKAEGETDAEATDREGDSDAEQPKKKRRRRRSRSSKSEGASDESSADESGKDAKGASDDEEDEATPAGPKVDMEMVINYVPGEECRVAIIEDGQLEELFAEPTDRVSRVGNIYVGKVINVEPAIQAAFVDFGCEENGFLHISDLHPQYFNNDDTTERVGKKTPRRDRPPIQEALKRGQEITVAVLKEGVGTKGPTLTSYLSIPGRFLVMMPGMDKVGVSRKEEDDDRRKAAKAILAQLDLPEGFGFILRTAGFDRTKAELKRDLAYLMRLWKDMERRRKGGNRPRPLYSESDLLLRSIRDLMSTDIRRVVIDSEPALKRAAQFMKIAAPRSQAKLAHYTGGAPIFHAFGIEEQIEAIHAREVFLPSGGRLVIDQTEALVAIDVNSGKSRSARDAETNAYKTNLEAVDAICRQLRLRDMGGLVVSDLIDMRHASHRKAIEQRFRDRLRRDRAKSTVGQISQFGLLEMTRQRMRGSMESQHFGECPTCHGRGLVQNPDSVASIALRDLAAIIDHEKVSEVELVVHPRVAGALLSTKRTALTRIELHSGKNVDVRVSETLKMDEFKFFASDHMGHDLSLEKMSGKKRPPPQVVEWRDDSSDDWAVDPSEEADETTAQKLVEEIARLAESAGPDQLPIPGSEDSEEQGEGTKKKRRRRRRRRSKGDQGDEGSESGSNETSGDGPREDRNDTPRDDQQEGGSEEREGSEDRESADGEGTKKKRRRRRRRGRGGGDSGSEAQGGSDGDRAESRPEARSEPKPEPKPQPEAKADPQPEVKPRRRGLYSGARRKLSPSEVARIVPE